MPLFKHTSDEDVIALCGDHAFNCFKQSILEAEKSQFRISRGRCAADVFKNWRPATPSHGGSFGAFEGSTLAIFGDDAFDLGLLGFLAKDGVKIPGKPPSPWGGQADHLCLQINRTGLAGFILRPTMSWSLAQAGLKYFIDELVYPVLTKSANQHLQSIGRTESLRTQMQNIGKLAALYSLDSALDRALPSVAQSSPHLADLLGIESAGHITFQRWADKEVYESAAEALFLHVMEEFGSIARTERGYFESLHELVQNLTCLPAQLFILQGESPRQVFDAVHAKLEFMLTYRHGDIPLTRSIIEISARLPFLPFPHLWPELGIAASDFLGIPARDLNATNSPFNFYVNEAWVGISARFTVSEELSFQLVEKSSSAQGVDFGNPEYLDYAGYGVDYLISEHRMSTDMLNRLLEISNVLPESVSGALFGHGLANHKDAEAELYYSSRIAKCSADSAAEFVYKKLTSSENRHMDPPGRFYSCLTVNRFLEVLAQHEPDFYQEIFSWILIQHTIPEHEAIRLLLVYGKPRDADLDKLEPSLLEHLLAREVGL